MLCFISNSFLLQKNPLPKIHSNSLLKFRKHDIPTIPKRWRMSTSDRSAEFFLKPDSSDSDEESNKVLNPVETDDLADWDDWNLTGKQMTIPALPFPPTDVFLPGESKQLHLFEARYLSLFETILIRYDKKCAHILIDSDRAAMAAFGTIIHVKNWRRLDLGISVDFQAVGRLKTARLKSSAPYISGDFVYVEDNPITDKEQIENVRTLEKRYWKAFKNVITLAMKLKLNPIRTKDDTASAKPEDILGTDNVLKDMLKNEDNFERLSIEEKVRNFEQTLKEIASAAVNYATLDFDNHDDVDVLQQRVKGLSFAAWEFFPSHPAARQKALELRDTAERLKRVITGLEEYARALAAKLALQDVFNET